MKPTGWRKSEALGLEWRNVDRKLGILRLEPGETENAHGREFRYTKIVELRALLDAQWTQREAVGAGGKTYHGSSSASTTIRCPRQPSPGYPLNG